MNHRCLKCNKKAITYIRYNGTHLCKEHFLIYVEKRVKKEIKKQGKLPKQGIIGVAVSGGKDSTVTLQLMHQILAERKNITLHAITIDEGIQGYRDTSIKAAQHLCNTLNIPHHITSFTTCFGSTMDEITRYQSSYGACTFCGVFRRFCLNTETKKHGITHLITGHNLDDISQSILMNFVNADLQKLARLGPHQKRQPGLTPRMMPLRIIPEKEIMLYALLKEIPFHNAECPYAYQALRGTFRDILDTLEDQNPGTKYSIIQSYDALKDQLIQRYPPVELNQCQICQEPTSQTLCKSCLLQQHLQTLHSAHRTSTSS